MRNKGSVLKTACTALGLLILIVDARTALLGAREGIDLCMRSVIPALFPFFILSGILTEALYGKSIPILNGICRLCRIPIGSSGLLAIGMLGGYPVGAKVVAKAYEIGKLSKADAQRLLGFCSNCGPAFLFGIVGSQFDSKHLAWLLWALHIISALAVGILIPGKTDTVFSANAGTVTLPQAMKQALHTMAEVCGWVIVMRIVIAFLTRWALWLIPTNAQILLVGLLELTNGCLRLKEISSVAQRFLFASLILGAGGLCVGLQTVSVTKALGTGMYFPGKLLQTSVNSLLCSILLPFLFHRFSWQLLLISLCASCISWFICRKKAVAISGKQMYNDRNRYLRGGLPCYSGKKSKNPAPTVPLVQGSTMSRCCVLKKALYPLTENAESSPMTPASGYR